MTSSEPGEFHLDITSQQLQINTLHTQLTFCFPLHRNDREFELQVIERLRSALHLLYENFPWSSGNVIRKQNTFTIQPPAEPHSLIVKYPRENDVLPEWDTLSRAEFPYKWLDETVVAVRNTVNDASELEKGLPVFLVQANFISGGLLLTFNSQHGATDMTGQAQLIRLFAKACRGDSYTSEELSIGNLDRRNIIPLLEYSEIEQTESVESDVKDDKESQQAAQLVAKTESPPLAWAYFAFSSQSLASLKSQAAEDINPGKFASTDDVLSAFVWQSVVRVRAARLGEDRSLESRLARNVDARRFFSLPPTYPGLLVVSTIHILPVVDLAKEHLGTVASQLRAEIDPAKLRRKIQARATLITQRGGAEINPTAPMRPQLELRLSSWAKETCYSLDFGEFLGKPMAVRRPRFAEGAREGLVYFLPKALDGEIVVAICVREDDMEVLKNDDLMSKWSRFIG